MIITKQMAEAAEDMFGPIVFGEYDAETVRQMMTLVGDMVPESPEDEQLKRDLFEQGKAALAELTK